MSKGVAPSPTPWRSSYWKGCLRVTLDYSQTTTYMNNHDKLVSMSPKYDYFILQLTKLFASMWHKAEWMGHPMRLELTRVGLLVNVANHYTTKGAQRLLYIAIYKALCFDVAQGRMNGAPNDDYFIFGK